MGLIPAETTRKDNAVEASSFAAQAQTDEWNLSPVPRLRHTPATRPGLEASLDAGHANSRSSGPKIIYISGFIDSPRIKQFLNLPRLASQNASEGRERKWGPTRRDRSKDQLGGTGKYCRRTFFGHATPDRAGARRPYASNVGSRDVEMGDRWPARPIAINRQIPGPLSQSSSSAAETRRGVAVSLLTFHPLSRLSRALFLRQSGDTYRTTGGMPCRKHGRAKSSLPR